MADRTDLYDVLVDEEAGQALEIEGATKEFADDWSKTFNQEARLIGLHARAIVVKTGYAVASLALAVV